MKSLPAGKHLYQLACGSASLQPYSLNIQPAIRSLDVEPSKSTIKSGQTVEFSITLQPTLDLTAILDCGASKIPLEIIHIEQTTDLAPILIGVFTLTIINNINERNQTMRRPVQLLESNNFTEQLDVNITTYGQQILHVRGEDFPTIREAQARFTVGTKITKKPQ
ncbi:unnamed protein product, partial [Rotaria socialis]